MMSKTNGQLDGVQSPIHLSRCVDVVIETLVLLLTGVLGVSLGTLSTYLYTRGKLEGLRDQVDMLKSMFQERDGRLTHLENAYEKIEDRIAVLEDITLERHGHLKPQPKRETPKGNGEDREILDLKILALHKNGYSIRQIAREVGLPKSTVHKRLKKLLETAKN